MGKYPPSRLLRLYSDWHYRINDSYNLYLADVDGFWVETRKSRGVVAAYDLKEPNAVITMTGKVVMDWFTFKKLPFYIVWPTYDEEHDDLKHFEVFRYYFRSLVQEELHWVLSKEAEKQVKFYSEGEYIEFLQNL